MRLILSLAIAVGSVKSAVALDAFRFQWDSPVGVVTRLYHDYAFSAVLEFNAPYEPVENEPRRVLEKYFDATLTEDLLRDQRCAVQSGGICNLDFQPMWNSQEQTATTVENIEDLPKAGDVDVQRCVRTYFPRDLHSDDAIVVSIVSDLLSLLPESLQVISMAR
jgi:hypothetical protein